MVGSGLLCVLVGGILLITSYFVAYRIGFNQGWEEARREEKQRGFPVAPLPHSHEKRQP